MALVDKIMISFNLEFFEFYAVISSGDICIIIYHKLAAQIKEICSVKSDLAEAKPYGGIELLSASFT